MMTTRRLRLWHWVQRGMARDAELQARKNASRALSTSKRQDELQYAQRQQLLGDFHLSAVMALNDCPDCIATTAEQDEANGL